MQKKLLSSINFLQLLVGRPHRVAVSAHVEILHTNVVVSDVQDLSLGRGIGPLAGAGVARACLRGAADRARSREGRIELCVLIHHVSVLLLASLELRRRDARILRRKIRA